MSNLDCIQIYILVVKEQNSMCFFSHIF